MSNLQRILNLAAKALESKGSPPAASGSGSGGSTASGPTDWRKLVRTAAEKVTGEPGTSSAPSRGSAPSPAGALSSENLSAEDRSAIARYDYLLKTADPAQLEQVHRDAFARLTPAQREQVEARLRADLPAYEQPASSSPDDLARAATRGEAHRPGFLRGLLSKVGGPSTAGAAGARGPGAGAVLGAAGVGAAAGAGIGVAGGLLAAVAGGAILSGVAGPLLEQAAGLGVDFEAFSGGIGEFATGTEEFAGGVGEFASGAEEQVAGLGEQAGEQVSGLGDQLSDFGSNFEIPGLGGLGSLFDR